MGKYLPDEFAKDLKALADKMQKKIDKGRIAYDKLAKLWDQVTKGGFTGSQKAVDGLFKDLNM